MMECSYGNALLEQLPENISERQVRAGLTSVPKRLSKSNELHDKNDGCKLDLLDISLKWVRHI